MSTTDHELPPAAAPPRAIDWGDVARTALGSAFLAGLVGGALHVLGKLAEAEHEDDAAPDHRDVAGDENATAPEDQIDDGDDDVIPEIDDEAARAAALLGVAPEASADEVRAALRLRLALSQLHPDQGGDGEEAKELIAAKNLLVVRARAREAP